MIAFLVRALRQRLQITAEVADLRRRVLAHEAATAALIHRLATELDIVEISTRICGDVGGGVRCYSTLQTRAEPCAAPGCPIRAASQRLAVLRADLEGR